LLVCTVIKVSLNTLLNAISSREIIKVPAIQLSQLITYLVAIPIQHVKVDNSVLIPSFEILVRNQLEVPETPDNAVSAFLPVPLCNR
jgi:hypothetical protein